MRVLFDNFYSQLNKNNNLFEQDNAAVGDNLLTPFKFLGEASKKRNAVFGTSHVIAKENADAIVFVDFPSQINENFLYGIKNDIPMYLITLESPIIKPEIFKKELHSPFKKVFTWSDDLIEADSEKYIKINYSYKITANFNFGRRPNDLIVISGNKLSSHSNELYTERRAVIKWYESNHKEFLDLYGIDWDIVIMPNHLIGIIFNKFNRVFKLFKSARKSYKGKLLRKAEVLSKYNFSLCFENAYGFNGYITEKVFDALMAGSIPIYKGAQNIDEYIPKNCFINYDNFDSISDLHNYISKMSDEEIIIYQKSIKSFLESSQAEQFTVSKFANTILDNILEGNEE